MLPVIGQPELLSVVQQHELLPVLEQQDLLQKKEHKDQIPCCNKIKLCDIDFQLLNVLLEGYDENLRYYLFQGLSTGFRIGCQTFTPSDFVGNHGSALEKHDVVSQKLDKEISLRRLAGPFSIKPFTNFICSPIGLVPKKEPNKFRLIHDLSFPKHNSINSHIPRELATVTYESLDTIVDFVASSGKGSLLAKADVESAFRNLPIHPDDYHKLGIFWENKYYYDKRLPFGCSTCCAIFESFSTALQWILQTTAPSGLV